MASDGEPGPASLTRRQQVAAHALYSQLLVNYRAGHPKSETIMDRHGDLRVSPIGHAVQIAVSDAGALMPSA